MAKPIIFNAEMVRALLDGRKTQTRRVVRPQPLADRWIPGIPEFTQAGWRAWRYGDRRSGSYWTIGGGSGRCPYGKPGDLLWVRETWEPLHIYAVGEYGSAPYEADTWHGKVPREHCAGLGVQYKADGDEAERWRPSIHMPRWASRLTLRLTDVRVQRVQDITDEEAAAEGGEWRGLEPMLGNVIARGPHNRIMFSAWWDSINAKSGHGWDTNPWCWCLSFSVIHRNVDAVDA